MASSKGVITRKVVDTDKAPSTKGLPFPQALVVGSTVYVSGNIGIDHDHKLVEGGIQAQTRQMLHNIGEVLKAAGASFDNVVKVSIFLKDMGHFSEMNEIYRTYFDKPVKPARFCVQVAALPFGALVEMEAVAVLGEIRDL